LARALSLIICVVFLLTACSSGGSQSASSFFAEVYDTVSQENDEAKKASQKEDSNLIPFMYEDICYSPEDVSNNNLDENIPCKSAIAFNINTSEILYSKNMHKKIYPASTTKLMTALITIRYASMKDVVIIDEDNCGITLSGAQLSGFKKGDRITIEDLLYCLLVYSANDAALALARHIGGTERGFVKMMNKEAAEIGCINTSFVNPHGLHDPNHYTTAYDMYLIFNECLKYESLKAIFKTVGYTVNIISADSTIKSLYVEPTNLYFKGNYTAPKGLYVCGGKTGDTVAAGKCLMLYSEDYDGQGFITEIFGVESKDVLYNSMNLLFNFILES